MSDEALGEPRSLEQRFVDGDSTVLADILRRFGPRTEDSLAKTYRGVLNSQDVEDIMSIATWRLWAAREKYDPSKGCVWPYFQIICSHVAVGIVRERHRAVRRLETCMGLMIEQIAAGDPEDEGEEEAIAAAQKLLKLKQCIDSLPEKYRIVILSDCEFNDTTASGTQGQSIMNHC
jgi:DNA-directed RNA polymerase specialized sigma24 family protein